MSHKEVLELFRLEHQELIHKKLREYLRTGIIPESKEKIKAEHKKKYSR